MNSRVSLVMNTPVGANKYELAIVAAREARRLNNQLRQLGETETSSAKVTTLALASTLRHEVAFQYNPGAAAFVEEAPAPTLPPVTPTE
jgi:DNA-directed RNA polymerase subunit K/omega